MCPMGLALRVLSPLFSASRLSGLHSFSTFQCTWEESHPAAELVTLLTCYWGTLSWWCAMHGSLQRLISTVFSVTGSKTAGHGCASQVTGGNGFESADWLSVTQALKDFWKHCCLCSPANPGAWAALQGSNTACELSSGPEHTVSWAWIKAWFQIQTHLAHGFPFKHAYKFEGETPTLGNLAWPCVLDELSKKQCSAQLQTSWACTQHGCSESQQQ